MMARMVLLVFLVFYVGISIAELCQEGRLEAVSENCFKFRLCNEKQWKEMTCQPPNEVFDAFKGKCVSIDDYCSSEKTSSEHCKRDLCKHDSKVPCKDGERKTLGCKHYSECISGARIQGECKEGETVKNGLCSRGTCSYTTISCRECIINGEHISCESGYYFDEDQSKCMPGFCEGIIRNACSEGETQSVKGSCKKYRQCVGGNFVDKRCSPCQNFDENKGKCVFIWDRPCTDGDTSTTTPSPSTTHSSTTHSSTTHSSTTHSSTTHSSTTHSSTTHSSTPSTSSQSTTTPTTTTVPPKCSPGQRKPVIGKCSKYFECDKNGKWEQHSCWWFFFFYFDVDSSKCKFWNAKCAK